MCLFDRFVTMSIGVMCLTEQSRCLRRRHIAAKMVVDVLFSRCVSNIRSKDVESSMSFNSSNYIESMITRVYLLFIAYFIVSHLTIFLSCSSLFILSHVLLL